MEKFVLKSKDNVCYNNKGVFELTKSGISGTYAMVAAGVNTDVQYSINCKKINFRGNEATLFHIRESTDIEKTHRKLIEDKYRGVLLSTITHDIKTPLTIIKGNVEILKDQVIGGDLHCINALLVAVNSLEYFVHDINVMLCINSL